MILNSSIASGGGRMTNPLLKESLFRDPSNRKLLDWLRIPFTLKLPVEFPNPPGVGVAVRSTQGCGSRNHSWNECSQLREVAAIERKIDDGLMIHHGAQSGVACLHQRCRAGYRNFFHHTAYRQMHVYARGAIYLGPGPYPPTSS